MLNKQIVLAAVCLAVARPAMADIAAPPPCPTGQHDQYNRGHHCVPDGFKLLQALPGQLILTVKGMDLDLARGVLFLPAPLAAGAPARTCSAGTHLVKVQGDHCVQDGLDLVELTDGSGYVLAPDDHAVENGLAAKALASTPAAGTGTPAKSSGCSAISVVGGEASMTVVALLALRSRRRRYAR